MPTSATSSGGDHPPPHEFVELELGTAECDTQWFYIPMSHVILCTAGGGYQELNRFPIHVTVFQVGVVV